MNRSMLRAVAVVLLLLMALTSVGYAQEDIPTLFFSGSNAYDHVANHVGVGPRPVGTTGSITAGNLILSHLDSLGWQTAEDWHIINLGNRSAFTPEALATIELWQPVDIGSLLSEHFAEADQAIEFDSLYFPVRNLVASSGDGNTIIIGAHYDSRIYSDKDPDESRRNLPMPGANDGGSGVGVLLELGRIISEHYTVNQEIRFVFFDAEDNGRLPPFPTLIPSTQGYLLGSILYANGLDLTTETIDYMLLLDLVGEFDQEFPVEGYSNQSAPQIVEMIWQTAADLGFAAQFPTEVRGAITDDHLPFIQRGIPAVDIIDLDYEYWDTSEDTLDKISPDSLERVGRVLELYLLRSGVISPK